LPWADTIEQNRAQATSASGQTPAGQTVPQQPNLRGSAVVAPAASESVLAEATGLNGHIQLLADRVRITRQGIVNEKGRVNMKESRNDKRFLFHTSRPSR
jgi:hypothetical protein